MQHHNSGVVVAGSLLLIVAFLQVLRVVYAVPVIIGGVEIPVWASYVGIIITGWLGYNCIRRSHME